MDCGLPGLGSCLRRLRGTLRLRCKCSLRFDLCIACVQVWEYSASYAHMRTCMEVADSTSWATAKAYDIMCRRTWNSRAKRGACRAASVLEPLPTFWALDLPAACTLSLILSKISVSLRSDTVLISKSRSPAYEHAPYTKNQREGAN